MRRNPHESLIYICCNMIPFILEAQILKKVCAILVEKAEEDDDIEFVLQILFCIYRFIINKVGVEFILQQENVMLYFLKLLQEKNEEITKMNDEILDILRVKSFI